MADTQLQTKCRQLLAGRDTPTTPLFYLVHDWRRQLVFAIAYVAVAAALWSINWRLASVAFFAFFVGRIVRDIRWWRALAKEWPTTAELIDWPRVEAIANETHEEDLPVA
ncbi:hypothetical protein [Neorhodopirellula lusitana]|uniref:hypothetical protein n=1 Tax=Neorhodopirellula lusitana TaxID=445327 RepID=UPI00384BE031